MLHEEARKKLCPFQQASCSPHMCMMWHSNPKDDSVGLCLLRAHPESILLDKLIACTIAGEARLPQLVHLTEAQKAELEEKFKDGAQPGTVEVVRKNETHHMDPAEARAVLEEAIAKQAKAKAEKKEGEKPMPKKPAPPKPSVKKAKKAAPRKPSAKKKKPKK